MGWRGPRGGAFLHLGGQQDRPTLSDPDRPSSGGGSVLTRATRPGPVRLHRLDGRAVHVCQARNRVTKGTKVALKAANSTGASFHSLRHRAGSWAAEAGMTKIEIAKLLGHASHDLLLHLPLTLPPQGYRPRHRRRSQRAVDASADTHAQDGSAADTLAVESPARRVGSLSTGGSLSEESLGVQPDKPHVPGGSVGTSALRADERARVDQQHRARPRTVIPGEAGSSGVHPEGGRAATSARRFCAGGQRKVNWLLDADIRGFFDKTGTRQWSLANGEIQLSMHSQTKRASC